MENYRQINVSSVPFNVDILSGSLWELDILGLNEYDNYLSIFVYESSNIDENIIFEQLNKLVSENLIETFSVETKIVENKNWNEEWENKINVIEVTENIIIKPSFRKYAAKENQIVIEIDPKMSFGTGEHQTTKLVLRMLDKYFSDVKSVLDVGSGTAVLGIAASMMGAENVIAVDNDEWCFINGKENVERNNLSNVKLVYGTIEDIKEDKFDLVMANINKNVLLEIKQELYNKVKHEGTLILSGLLVSDLAKIQRQFTQIGLTALEFQQLDEWISIIFKKT